MLGADKERVDKILELQIIIQIERMANILKSVQVTCRRVIFTRMNVNKSGGLVLFLF